MCVRNPLTISHDFQSFISIICICKCLCISEFIEGVSQFSVKGDKESKLRCKYWCLCWDHVCSSIYLLFSHVTFFIAEFIDGVSQFSVKCNKESKLRCKYETQRVILTFLTCTGRLQLVSTRDSLQTAAFCLSYFACLNLLTLLTAS